MREPPARAYLDPNRCGRAQLLDNLYFQRDASLMRLYFEGELETCVEITPALHAQRSTLVNRVKWAMSFFIVSLGDYTVTRRLNFGGE